MKPLPGDRCPKCGVGFVREISSRTGGFSLGKAAVGAVVAGPIGLVAGALGKKKKTYQCNKCGYIFED